MSYYHKEFLGHTIGVDDSSIASREYIVHIDNSFWRGGFLSPDGALISAMDYCAEKHITEIGRLRGLIEEVRRLLPMNWLILHNPETERWECTYCGRCSGIGKRFKHAPDCVKQRIAHDVMELD